MSKLAAVPSSTSTCNPSISCIIRTRLHLHLQSKPKSRCRLASSHVRPLAHAHAQPRHGISFYPKPTSTSPLPSSQTPFNFKYSIADGLDPKNRNDHKPPDERVIKLGKTLRILSPLLPTILINPLPPHILSPSVTLHLFPSTHPHLPTVKGRTLYRAALWAVPVAWSSVPLVGNVKLQILSERIVRAGTVLDPATHTHAHTNAPNNDCARDERLVVRWRTEPTKQSHTPTPPSSSPSSTPRQPNPTTPNNKEEISGGTGTGTGTNKSLSVLLGGDAPIFKLSNEDQFTGLFIFSFDEEGRVLTQTIEHAEDASGWERTAKFVTLTDWLIGKARESLDPAPAHPGLVGCFETGSESGGSGQCQERSRDHWQGTGGDGARASF